MQIAVPSREQIPAYQTLRQDVDELVGADHRDYGRLGRSPGRYLYQSFPMTQLAAFYRAADVALVTPWIDGMNLVAKEFVASRTDDTGALVLSQFAGAARELGQGAYLANPHDLDGLQRTILHAIHAPQPEQTARMAGMRRHVQDNDVTAWASATQHTPHPRAHHPPPRTAHRGRVAGVARPIPYAG